MCRVALVLSLLLPVLPAFAQTQNPCALGDEPPAIAELRCRDAVAAEQIGRLANRVVALEAQRARLSLDLAGLRAAEEQRERDLAAWFRAWFGE